MIINQKTVDIEKSSNFESTEFRIDEKYKNKVLWMLINQYSFKIRTPIQEIVSNARDAQRENGNPDKPIKIQLPTRIDPTFIVRDYGVGMDEKRIKDIFTSFGASTKNTDNEQTGGFGIGAKSPLAYTDSFNIKTYVNGQYWFYVIAKTENDGIGINLIDQGSTEEPNGTEVQIPVKKGDNRSFIKAACRCTMFWDIKPLYNLDDEEIFKVNKDNATKVNDNFEIFKANELGGLFNNTIIICVDGIPYELDSYAVNEIKPLKTIRGKLKYDTHAVIYLNTGDIDLLQTRESIDRTDRTTHQLNKICLEHRNGLLEYIKNCFTEKSLSGILNQFEYVKKRFENIQGFKFEKVIPLRDNKRFSLDNKLSLLEYSYRGRSYYKDIVSTIQRHVDDNDFSHKDFDCFFWDDLKDSESDNMKTRRMRYQVEQTNKRVILINQGNATNFVYLRTLRLLKAKKLSSLEKPPKSSKKAGGGVQRKAASIYAHYLIGSSSPWGSIDKRAKHVKVDEVNKIHLYLGYSDSNKYFEDKQMIYILNNSHKVSCVRLSKKDVKTVKNNHMFIHIDDFMMSFKPTQELLNYHFNRAVKSLGKKSGTVKRVYSMRKKLNDKMLAKLSEKCYIKKVDDLTIPRTLEDSLMELNRSRIDSFLIANDLFINRINLKYPELSGSKKRDLYYINRVN